jgi:hypothetical protein
MMQQVYSISPSFRAPNRPGAQDIISMHVISNLPDYPEFAVRGVRLVFILGILGQAMYSLKLIMYQVPCPQTSRFV